MWSYILRLEATEHLAPAFDDDEMPHFVAPVRLRNNSKGDEHLKDKVDDPTTPDAVKYVRLFVSTPMNHIIYT